MQAGKLRHRISIRKRTVTRGTYGEEVVTWSEHAQCWAEIDPPKSREFFGSGQTQADVIVRMRIRYVEGVKHEMQVLYGTRKYDIVSISNPDERNKELIMQCKEKME